MKKSGICFILFMLIKPLFVFSQLQNNQWRFGFNAAIDFNTNPPSFPSGAALPSILPPLITGSMIEGSASVADRNSGALLFYTDGVTVWNAQNKPMPNGSNLGGSDLLSSFMAAVIVPVPGTFNKYYVFCIDDYELGSKGITYSLVDMNLDNGLGDVVAGKKSIPLYDNETELLQAYPKSSGDGYWIISNGNDANNPAIAAFEVNAQGVNPVPVLSPIIRNGSGKLNYQGTKYACSGKLDVINGTLLGFQLYDFNAATGEISTTVDIPFIEPGGDILQYFEFSFDGKYLFAGGNFSLYRFDLTAGNPAEIGASAALIPFGNQVNKRGGMQFGPDGNLYYVIGSRLFRIENPGNPAPTIGPVSELPTEIVPSYALPQWIHLLPRDTSAAGDCAKFDLGDTLTVCINDTVKLQANLSGFSKITGLQWLGGAGKFIPSDTVASARYVPTAAERAQGFLNLSLQVNAISSTSGQGGKLIAYDHLGEDLIFYISPGDGSIDTIQDNAGDDWLATGFESSTSLLYGVSVSKELGNVNLQTGEEKLITFGYAADIFSGEYDNINGIFYAVGAPPQTTADPVNQQLFTINTTTGALTTVGNLNLFTRSVAYYGLDEGINGLAYDPAIDVLYGISYNGNLYRINVSNASAILVGPTAQDCRGLAYDPVTQKLWGIKNDATLIEINKNTGAQLSTVPCKEQFAFITSLTYVAPGKEVEITCSDTLHIVLSKPGGIIATANPQSISQGDTVQLGASGGQNYLWSPDDNLSCNNCADPKATPNETTSYIVSALNAFGCLSSDTVLVPVNVRCYEPFIPTIFSPNGKGPQANETFCILSDCVDQYKLFIHNRWGEKVFESSDVKQCWDGNHAGTAAAAGVYAFNLYIRRSNGSDLIKTGTITLVR
jgi:gliding motility-associated-like protein